MRFAIVVEENRKNVSEHFGEAAGIIVYENGEETYIVNPGANSNRRKGRLLAETIVKEKIEEVILKDCSENAGEFLKINGVKILEASGRDVETNIKLFKEMKLDLFTSFHPNKHKNRKSNGKCHMNQGMRCGRGHGLNRGRM